MIPIPAEIETLLRSRSMVGTSRPNHKLEIVLGGAPEAKGYIESISLRRSYGMADMVTVIADNKAGRYSPDNFPDGAKPFWPGNELRLWQGYGADAKLVKVVTGLIDRVEMETWPQKITITGRDKRKKLSEQYVYDDYQMPRKNYASQTIESIARDLAKRAGWADEDIITETTGLTLSQIAYNKTTYGDALSKLCEFAGFEVKVDHDGKLYFVRETTRQPLAYDEPHVLTGTDWTNLLHPYIVAESDIVTDHESTYVGEITKYSRDTDYEIEYGSPSRIRRRVGSTIPSGATVYTKYVWAAWSFLEGQDIVSLRYTIDDDDLFYKAAAEGRDQNGNPISKSTLFRDRNYYQIHAQKTLWVNAPEADTEAKVQAIADRAEYVMRSRSRVVDFAAIGNPYLQPGDCVRVVESSTTISEIYRIMDISTTMDANGYIMQMRAYHYGYTPEV